MAFGKVTRNKYFPKQTNQIPNTMANPVFQRIHVRQVNKDLEAQSLNPQTTIQLKNKEEQGKLVNWGGKVSCF
eukprot:302889-Amphidinium_carterae.1